jgi:hypothetical protein
MDVAAYLSLLLAVVCISRAAVAAVVGCHAAADLLAMLIVEPQHAVLAVWLAPLFWVARDVMWRGENTASPYRPLLLTAWATLRFGAEVSYTAGAFHGFFWRFCRIHKRGPHSRGPGVG